MLDHCPGAANLKTPTLTIKKCPQCGEEVELFSNDVSVQCSGCGFITCNDIESCIQWCRHAKEWVGEEMYRKLWTEKISPNLKNRYYDGFPPQGLHEAQRAGSFLNFW
jgi:hypothetical protein